MKSLDVWQRRDYSQIFTMQHLVVSNCMKVNGALNQQSSERKNLKFLGINEKQCFRNDSLLLFTKDLSFLRAQTQHSLNQTKQVTQCRIRQSHQVSVDISTSKRDEIADQPFHPFFLISDKESFAPNGLETCCCPFMWKQSV